jgi:ribosomal protein S18 acetylase RimI-like enzyme
MQSRRAEERDVAAICRICSDGWRETYRDLLTPEEIDAAIARFYLPERVRGELQETDGWGGYWVTESDGRVVAAAGGGMTGPGVGELFVLYVDPPERGRGAGSVALQAVTDQQVAQGAREQWASVQPDNALAIPFYEARGFVRRGERPAYEAPGRTSLRYWRSLEG